MYPFEAHTFLQTVVTQDGLRFQAAQTAKVFGELGIRLVAHVFQRPLLGKFTSLSAIALVFLSEVKALAEAQGKEVTVEVPPAWAKAAPKAETSEKSTTKGKRSRGADLGKAVVLASTSSSSQDMSLQVSEHLAMKGCKVGAFCFDKKSEDRFEVTEIQATCVSLKMATAGQGPSNISVEPARFFEKYRVEATKDEQFLTSWDYECKLNHDVQIEFISSSIKLELKGLHDASVETFKNKIKLRICPIASRGVFATVAINKGELSLVPMTTSVVFASKEPNHSVEIGQAFGLKIYLCTRLVFPTEPQPSLQDTSVKAKTKSECIFPFWLVTSTASSSRVKMHTKYAKFKVHGDLQVHVPCFKNSKAIKAGDELSCFKEEEGREGKKARKM